MHNTTKIVDSRNTYIDDSVVIGNNVTIDVNNIIKGNTVIGDGVVLGPGNYINNSHICEGAHVEFSYIEESVVGAHSSVGPQSRLRPNSKIGEHCKIGNFVEIKNATIGNRTKASHLAYVGDADVGEDCNIGCGAIFVNYNGKEKKRSVIGDHCFIGSNVNVVAPVKVANYTYVCAGSTITIDTHPGDFVIARSRETIKEYYSLNYSKNKTLQYLQIKYNKNIKEV